MDALKWDWWVVWGMLAQGLFTARFAVQWLVSEREKKSVIPDVFWLLSVSGAAMLLLYAIRRADPVFILGQSLGMIVYFRNLALLDRQRTEQGGKPGLVRCALAIILGVLVLRGCVYYLF